MMTIGRSKSALLVCTAMALLAANSATYAQDAASQSSGTTVLERITVKGKRVVPGSVADTPFATETTAAQIEKKQITSIMDLGRTQEPGVSFNRSTGSVNIRGLEDSRVLTTVDGIPLTFLSDATRGATGGLDTFDFSSLSAVDVVRGADSSRAGPGALGGVLAIRTLEPEDLIGEGRNWGGITKFNYDSSDRSFSPSAAIASKIDNTSILFQGSYRKGHERDSKGAVDSYGATRTKPNPLDYDQYNLLFKLRQELEGGHTIGLTAERFLQDKDIDPRTLLSAAGNYRPGNYTGDDGTERDRLSIDYKYEALEKDGLIDAASASLYWQKQVKLNGYDAYRFNSVIGPITRLNDYEQNGLGLIGTAEKNFVTGDLNHRLVFGYDLYTGFAEQYSQGTDNCSATTPTPAACANLHTNQADTPKVDTNRIGFYVDDLIDFGSTGFSLNPGVRFDWVEHTPKMTAEFDRNASNPSLPAGFSDTAISPKLRAAYEVNDKLEFYGQWAMGFRAPTSGELYASFGGPGTYLRLGNPDLESEISNGFEVGANIGDDDFGGRVNLFYNRYKNFIDTKSLTATEAAAAGYVLASYPQGGITQNINLDHARIYGAEVSAHKRFDNGISVRTGVAYANGKDTDTGAFLKSVAPLKAVVGLAYDTETWGFGVDWIGVKESRGQTTTTTAGPTTTINYLKTPGYGVFDLTAWWEPEQVKGLKINAGIYNVFDKTYFDYSSARNGGSQPVAFYSEPGRSFKISLTQRF
ncbi:TonB-dependent hemoglobin/transferrin/lactoferrin family receptor [Agrobacterium sp. rho-13.3]|nr:TonB-dependent hemoglobin/transferrin/lactoferrin family receptor [Agrobacterium sp. rho-13.3]